MKTINGDTPQFDASNGFPLDRATREAINFALREWSAGRKDENRLLKKLLAFSVQLMSRPQKGMLDSLFAKAAELGIQLERVRE